jgi:hypothetical protein
LSSIKLEPRTDIIYQVISWEIILGERSKGSRGVERKNPKKNFVFQLAASIIVIPQGRAKAKILPHI